MDKKEIIIKLLRVTVALALVAGGVILMRYVAHDLLRAPQSIFSKTPKEITRPTPTIQRHVLKDLIPTKAQLTFAGVIPERSNQLHDMPLTLAQEVIPTQLQARGWQRIEELPAELKFELDLRGIQVWLTPEQDYVQIALEAVDAEHTRERTFRIRATDRHAQPFVAPTMLITDEEQRAIAMARMRRSADQAHVERQLPPWMAQLCLGSAMSTQFSTRDTGASFYLTTSVQTFTPKSAQKEIARRAKAIGWHMEAIPEVALQAAELDHESTAMYTYDNILCFVRCTKAEDGTAITYRFSDDEADLNPLFSQPLTPSIQ